MRFVLLVLFIIFSSKVMASDGSTSEPLHPKHVKWSFDGAFGSVDREAAQRGFKVYKEVCSACHSLKRVAFRNLMELGFSEAEIKSLAASYSIKDGPNAEGEMFERPGRVSDYFVGPYANIIKARENGANYVYSLLTGYEDPPQGFQLGENMHYNPYFSGGGSQFAMTPPLTSEGQVEYTDGTKPTVDQMAKDDVNFLQWVAEPEMENRKSLGVKILIFTSLFTAIMYFAYKRIWRDVK